MHVLVAGFGSWGDVQPMVALARALGARGHGATVAGPPDYASRARDLGVTYAPVGVSLEAFYRANSDSTGKLSASPSLGAMRDWFASHYAPLAPLVEGADVVLSATMTLAPLDLAEKFGKRAHFLMYCPQGIPSSEHPMPGVRYQELPGWLNWLSFQLFFVLDRLAIRSLVDAERRKLGLGTSPPFIDRIYQNLVVASEPALAPPPRDVRADRRVFQPGAFYLDSEVPLSDRVRRFLECGPPPVYVGFGSMLDVAPERTSEWVARAARQAGGRVIQLGPTDAEDDVVLTVTGANHEALFPRCAGVVHHGGAGTTAVAARAGVPQVIVPHEMDQYFWANRLQRLGVLGPAVTARKHSVPELAEALRAVIVDEKLKERARALRGGIHGDGTARMVAALENRESSPWPS